MGGVDKWVRGFVGGLGQILALVAWIAWVPKILVCVARVEIFAWVGWVHKSLAWVAWVEILVWVVWLAWIKKVTWVNVLSFNHTLYEKKCVFYRTWYNCTNQIQQVLQLFFVILTLFRASLIQMKPVCNAFLDLFSNLISLVFFKNYGYLFFLTCKNNQKNYERAESE